MKASGGMFLWLSSVMNVYQKQT
uniref:Uncharacterized protein n=1 Tax=Arundo donax TaxID=35708 RepID=A0A0A8YMI7_ARUDO